MGYTCGSSFSSADESIPALPRTRGSMLISRDNYVRNEVIRGVVPCIKVYRFKMASFSSCKEKHLLPWRNWLARLTVTKTNGIRRLIVRSYPGAHVLLLFSP